MSRSCTSDISIPNMRKHRRAGRLPTSPTDSHPSSPSPPSSGSKVVLDPLPPHPSIQHEQHNSCSCATPSPQKLQQTPYPTPLSFPGYPQIPIMMGHPQTILIPTSIHTGSVPSLPWGITQLQHLQQQQQQHSIPSPCGSCPIHQRQIDHHERHHQRSNSDSPTRRRLSKHAPLASTSPPASASSTPTSPTRIAREKSPVDMLDTASIYSTNQDEGKDTADLAEITSTILASTVASLVHDLVLVEYAQAKLDQVRATKQFPWSTSPRDPLAHLAASLLNEVVVQETRHLVRMCIHDAVLAQLKRDATDRMCETLIEQCVREVVVSTVAELEAEGAGAAAEAVESGAVVSRGSSEGETEGVRQAGSVLKALVADELLARYFGTMNPTNERQNDVASLWPMLLAVVADQLLDRI